MQPKQPHILYHADWYIRETHLGIAEYAKKAGWSLEAEEHSSWVNSHFKGDGILVFFGTRPETATLLCNFTGPVINLGPRPDWDGYRVTIDNYTVGQLAASYFLARGFQNFCMLPSWSGDSGWAVRFRAKGFASAITKAGLPLLSIPPLNKENPEQFRATLKAVLENCKGPLALYKFWYGNSR